MSGARAPRPQKSSRFQLTKGLTKLNVMGKPAVQPLKIITPTLEQKPCVCGASLIYCHDFADGRDSGMWRCKRHCGARGLSYEGALRRKLRLDLLSWGDLRRKARALVAAEKKDCAGPLSDESGSGRDSCHRKSVTRTDNRILEYHSV